MISGKKWEPATLLYVRNIETGNLTDEEICQDVKDYGTSVGIRIMYAHIVRNRFCEDVVGCKILVPDTKVEQATSWGTWPDDIECRKWEKRTQTSWDI